MSNQMTINKSVIAKLNPCSDRFDNYVNHYGERDFTVRQFMGLKNITHADKLWVAFRLLPKGQIPKAATDMAELVLHVYEAKYPNDKRPREAIEAVRSGDKERAKKAAYAAAYAAAAAADTAYAAAAANAAAKAAGKDGKKAMQKRQRTILIKYLKEAGK